MSILTKLALTASFMGLLFFGCAPKRLSFSEAIKQCEEKKVSKQGVSSPSASCAQGSLFPYFEGTTITGQVIDKSYFKGKISIVNLWFIGCPPCVAEIPGFNQIVQKYGKDRIQYIAIARDPQEEVEAFLKTHPWAFDHVSDGKSIIYDQIKSPWGYPTTFVVDRKGVIAKAVLGGFSDSTASEKIQAAICPVLDSLLGEKK